MEPRNHLCTCVIATGTGLLMTSGACDCHGRKKNPSDTRGHHNCQNSSKFSQNSPKIQAIPEQTHPVPGSCRYPLATFRASWASIFTDFRVGVLPGMAWMKSMKSRAASAPGKMIVCQMSQISHSRAVCIHMYIYIYIHVYTYVKYIVYTIP